MLEGRGLHVLHPAPAPQAPGLVHIAMNAALGQLLHSCGLERVVEVVDSTFADLVPLYRERLVRGEVEGVVVSVGGEVVKWKSSRESLRFYMEEMEACRDKVDQGTFEAFMAIAEESVRVEEVARGRSRAEQLLEAAYRSALTKTRSLEEHLEGGGEEGDWRREVEEEMRGDADPVAGYPEASIATFLASRVAGR